MSDPIPKPYRVFFRVVDPTLSLFGVIMHLQSDKILPNYALEPTMPPATETRLLLDALVGFFAGLAFLQAVLLRARPNDVVVWKCLQAATILIDLAMLAGFYRALSSTGRLDVSTWRNEEWNNIMINSFVAMIRTLFVLGVGMPKIKEA